MRIAAAIGASLVLCSTAIAQALSADPYGALATGSPAMVEEARRRLVVGDPESVEVGVLEALLRHEESARRRAALSVLAHHELLSSAARSAAAEYPDSRDILIACGSEAFARGSLDPEMPYGHRLAAFWRLEELGALTEADWRSLLEDGDPRLSRAAATRLVYCRESLPVASFAQLTRSGRRAILEALAARPRRAARAWLREVAKRDDLDLADDVLVRLALPPDEWNLTDARLVLDALVSEDPDARSAALDAADLMSVALADSLVSEVHARVLDGGDAEILLRALDELSPKGARHLVALARVLPGATREQIVEWLAARRSPVVDELVEDALAGRATVEPFVLRQASPELLARPELLAAMRALLADPAQPLGIRLAAFDALIGAGRYQPELLAFTLDSGQDVRPNVRRILSLPASEIPDGAWSELLALPDRRTVRMVLARMAEAPRLDRNEELVLALTQREGPVALAAAEVCLRAGSRELAERVWSEQSSARRGRLALALRHRREEWVLPLLQSEPLTGPEPFPLVEARIAQGERASLEFVLARPRTWPIRWLVRLKDTAPPLLHDDDLDTVRDHLFGENALASVPHRVELITWVTARPDLDAIDVLREARANGEPEERDVALRGLLAIDESARQIRERVNARIAVGLREDERDVAFEAAGALVPPLGGEGVRLVARLALVEPLARPLEELGDPPGRAALANLLWQQLGREPSPAAEGPWSAVVLESLEHPHAHVASRRRLGELLALLARTEATRELLAPALAEAVLATPDPDREHIGGARLIQAEAHERAGRFEDASVAYLEALRELLRWPSDPLQLRAFVGDGYRGSSEIWPARLSGRAWLCSARAHHAAGRTEDALRSLDKAADLAEGDVVTARAVEDFRQEMER